MSRGITSAFVVRRGGPKGFQSKRNCSLKIEPSALSNFQFAFFNFQSSFSEGNSYFSELLSDSCLLPASLLTNHAFNQSWKIAQFRSRQLLSRHAEIREPENRRRLHAGLVRSDRIPYSEHAAIRQLRVKLPANRRVSIITLNSDLMSAVFNLPLLSGIADQRANPRIKTLLAQVRIQSGNVDALCIVNHPLVAGIRLRVRHRQSQQRNQRRD